MLEVKNIFKTFNKGTINEKHALNGVNLTMNDGDFITVSAVTEQVRVPCSMQSQVHGA